MSDEIPDGIYDFAYRPAPERLSPNGAKKLLQPAGPARFDYERSHPRRPEPKFDMGKLVHRIVLGAGEEIAPSSAPTRRRASLSGMRTTTPRLRKPSATRPTRMT